MNHISLFSNLPPQTESHTCAFPQNKVKETAQHQSLFTQLMPPLFYSLASTLFLREAVKNVHKAKKSFREGNYIQASKQSFLSLGYSCGAAFACSQTVEALKTGFLQHSNR